MECSLCHGRYYDDNKMIKNDFGEYICPSCLMNRDYGERNTRTLNTPVKSGITYGFEFECRPKNKKAKANLITGKYKMIPTKDCSMPKGCTELKTPIIRGKRNLNNLFKLVEKNSKTGSNCGSHIHIGSSLYNYEIYYWLRYNYYNIFNELGIYMNIHKDSTEILCGRKPSEAKHYARIVYNETTHNIRQPSRYVFINIRQETVEFRISKFVNAKQYKILTEMWTDMFNAMVKQYYKNKNTRQLSKKLVKIFKKYEDKYVLTNPV